MMFTWNVIYIYISPRYTYVYCIYIYTYIHIYLFIYLFQVLYIYIYTHNIHAHTSPWNVSDARLRALGRKRWRRAQLLLESVDAQIQQIDKKSTENMGKSMVNLWKSMGTHSENMVKVWELKYPPATGLELMSSVTKSTRSSTPVLWVTSPSARPATSYVRGTSGAPTPSGSCTGSAASWAAGSGIDQRHLERHRKVPVRPDQQHQRLPAWIHHPAYARLQHRVRPRCRSLTGQMS